MASSPDSKDVSALFREGTEEYSKQGSISSGSSDSIENHPNVPDNVEEKEAQIENDKKYLQNGITNLAFIPDEKEQRMHNGISENSSIKYSLPDMAGRTAWEENSKSGTETTQPTVSVIDSGQNNLIKQVSENSNDTASWLNSHPDAYVPQRFRTLVRAFANRAQRMKERIVQPVTPSSSPPPPEDENAARTRFESLIQNEETLSCDESWMDEQVKLCFCRVRRRYIPSFPKVLEPQSKLYISWLFVVTISYVYNAWVIFLRVVFPYQTPKNLPIFFTFDYLCDVIYIIDIVLFKVRLKFLHDGFWVNDPVSTRKHYIKKAMFKLDVLSLLPLDILYLQYGPNALFRLPRLLKVQTFWEFFNRVDAVARSPYVIRIIRTLIYMMYLIHLNACAYYAMSKWEGIKSNSWVFNGEGNAYIRCFYFATKTATSIGKNPKPTNEYEYVFMTICWLLGVFIFAFLIGQIRDIVATATQSETQYRQLMDESVRYMRTLNLPDELQRRVRLWLNHTWEQQKTLNESSILDSLPRKMKTDVAINVHYNTLVKVQLFKDCDKAFLRDLVLKLKPVLFLPGDYICRKGEVGNEMYIVKKGLVQVMGGETGKVVLATLSEGSVFGEISLLGIPGFSRRTADVCSQGFSNLFVLSKDDLWDALKNYPDAQQVLKKKAKSLIKKNEVLNKPNQEAKEVEPEVIISSPVKNNPKLMNTVLQVMKPDSLCAQLLQKHSANAAAAKLTANGNSSSNLVNGNDFITNGLKLNDTKLLALRNGVDSKSEKALLQNKCIDQLNEQQTSDVKEFLQNILDMIPENNDKISDANDKNMSKPTNTSQEESNIPDDLKHTTEKFNASQENLISSKINSSEQGNETTHTTKDAIRTLNRYNTEDSNIDSHDIPYNDNDWMSLRSSILSLNSLFECASFSSDSINDRFRDPHISGGNNSPTMYRTPSIISDDSSLDGYENLGFVPPDDISSRRSSLYNEETF